MTGGFVTLPKAEVHVHLEGCFEVDDIVRLARENGVQLPRPRERLLEFGGLAEFLQFLDWICGLVRTREQLAMLARRFQRTVGGERHALCRCHHQSDALARLVAANSRTD